ncbi:rhodanese-like domain-containing protein [Paenibacillus sp. sgz302251]|uniref:rhodanese-like domain-containing protein n=1 Tax=Paenibacillus sp. sgz302251 TaxID=3414493 RepID=UPI003C79C4E6
MDNGTIINIVIILFLGWFVYRRFGPAKGLRTLRDKEFQNELKNTRDWLLIDVRETHEYKSGFIPGARNIPLSVLHGRLDEIPKDRELFLYCRSGMRSKNAARILHKQGYTRFAHLQGGIGAWSGSISK